MKKVLFYDDGSSFGGHTVTVVDAVRYLVENTNLNVSFMFYEGNKILYERLNLLKQFGNLQLYPTKYKEPKLKTIGALFSFATVQQVKNNIDNVNPDIVIVAQGCIEQCSLGLLAAKKGKYKTISFIALTQTIAVMGGKLAQLRDVLNLYFYRLPDEFITISKSAKSMLKDHGVKSKISLVYCGVNLRFWQFRDRSFRDQLGINESDYVVALIGRVQFAHKGHDFLIDSICKSLSKLENIKFLIVGNGQDVHRLESLIESNGLSKVVKLFSWSNDPSYIYSAIDMLIIPSRFEGLPLVMLEAMYYSLPIVASNVDGMAEVLPKEWLFQFGDSNSFIETLIRVKHQDNTEFFSENKRRIITEFNVDKFGDNFYQAIF